jgi:hypothetical protein
MDVDDCVNAAKYLVETGRADEEKLVIDRSSNRESWHNSSAVEKTVNK